MTNSPRILHYDGPTDAEITARLMAQAPCSGCGRKYMGPHDCPLLCLTPGCGAAVHAVKGHKSGCRLCAVCCEATKI